MRKDYHMHPQILQQPDRFDEFVATALQNGVEEICITDHMPLLCSAAKDRIPKGAVREYCERGRRLAEQVAGRLSVKVGIEVDYHPTIRGEIEAVLKEGDFDFILGSSHLHAIRSADIFNRVKTRDEYADEMLKNTVSAASSGYFNAIAHIDMYRWVFSKTDRFPLEGAFHEERHAERIEQALDAILAAGLRLEINPHFAVSKQDVNQTYPSEYIVRRALEKGIPFSYGSDAHVPDQVGVFLPELRAHSVYGRALARWENE